MNYTGNDNLEIMKFAKNYNNFLTQIVVDTIKQHNSKNLLDFGCADGFFIEKIYDAVGDINICGIEVDETSYKKCNDKGIEVYSKIDSVHNNIDFIYSFNVLEHIKDDIAILKELNNILSDKGYFVVYVPALQFLYSSMDKKTGHFRRYEKKELINKLKQVGFKIERIEFCDSLGVLATLMYILKDKISSNNGNLSKNGVILYDNIFPISRFLDKILFKNICGKNLFVVARKI